MLSALCSILIKSLFLFVSRESVAVALNLIEEQIFYLFIPTGYCRLSFVRFDVRAKRKFQTKILERESQTKRTAFFDLKQINSKINSQMTTVWVTTTQKMNRTINETNNQSLLKLKIERQQNRIQEQQQQKNQDTNTHQCLSTHANTAELFEVNWTVYTKQSAPSARQS